jgi:hypothetical protein
MVKPTIILGNSYPSISWQLMLLPPLGCMIIRVMHPRSFYNGSENLLLYISTRAAGRLCKNCCNILLDTVVHELDSVPKLSYLPPHCA